MDDRCKRSHIKPYQAATLFLQFTSGFASWCFTCKKTWDDDEGHPGGKLTRKKLGKHGATLVKVSKTGSGMTLEDDVLCWNGTCCSLISSVPTFWGWARECVDLWHWAVPGLRCQWQWPGLVSYTFLFQGSTQTWFASPHYPTEHTCSFGLNPDVTFVGQVALTSGTPQIFDRLHKDHAHRMWVLEDSSLRKPFFSPHWLYYTGYAVHI